MESQQELRLELIKNIVDNTSYFVGLTDLKGRLAFANKTSLDFIGLKEKDVLGKYFWDCPWWTHSVREQNQLKKSVKKAANGETIQYETSHVDSQNNLHYVSFSIRPVKDSFGEI